MSAGGVTREKRHTRAHPCAICGGFDEQDRGAGKRCSGFDSEDGTYIRCSRPEFAGRLDADGNLYRHVARGECRCGVTHLPFRSSRREPEAVYDYRDASGKLLVQVTRWPGKKFSQRRPEGAGGWIQDAQGVPWTLYHLERIAKTSGPVWVVEGERDVETLEKRGLVATTNRGGAGSGAAGRCDYGPLRGRWCIIVADADDTGRTHASDVANRIRAAGGTVTGPLECAGGKDVTDHLASGGGLDVDAGDLVPMRMPAVNAAPATGKRERPPIKLTPAPPASDEEVPWSDDEPPEDGDPKPEIVMGTDLHRVIAELEKMIAALDPGLYQRGRELVTVLGADGERGVADGTPVISPLSQSAILPRITERVQFVRITMPKKDEVELASAQGRKPEPTRNKIVPPTTHVVQPLLARGEWPNVRLLKGITEAPCLRPDGTILQAPGYDPMTRYLYAPNADYWPVPDAPTQADARAALDEIRALFVHFPFSEPAGSVVAIGALLTSIARPAIDGPVPAFVFEASVRGAGKTLQCDVVHMIATGRSAPHGEWPANDEEQKKTLNGIALAAPSMCVFDNIKGVFGGSSIEAALTSDRVSFRVLGGLSTADVPWQTVVLASGNQIEPTDDMVRRMLVSRLEPAEEDPTTRTGLPDLRAIVRTRRPAFVRAALTVLRAYALKDYPDAGARLASFDAWARIVPGAILFAGGPDLTAARLPPERATTDALAAAYVLVTALPGLVSTSGGLTTKALLGRLYPPPESPDGYDDVREAVELIAPPKGPRPDAQLLAKRMSKLVGRWFGRTRLVRQIDGHTKHVRWSAEVRVGQKGTTAETDLPDDDIPRG